MLKTIDPLLTPDLLRIMAQMGHGDDLAVVDANFPAASVAAQTHFGEVITVTNAQVEDVVRAVLTLLPLDEFEDKPVRRMEVIGEPRQIPESQKAVVDEIGAQRVGSLERFAFYEAAKNACAVVHAAADCRPYGCFLLKKGVIFPQ